MPSDRRQRRTAPRAVPSPLPIDEAARLRAIERVGRHLEVDDAHLLAVAESVADALEVPRLLVTLVEFRRQVVLAGVGTGLRALRRDHAPGSLVVGTGQALAIEDLAGDHRFAHSSLVARGPRLRAWLGAPIRSADDHVIGTVCAFDHAPRSFDRGDLALVEHLAEHVAFALEQRALARAVDTFVVDDLDVAHGSDRAVGAAVEATLAVVADHQGWPMAWAHAHLEGAWQVVGARGIDPADLHIGLALHEMRHRLLGLGDRRRVAALDLDEVPSTLAIAADEVGARSLVAVPIDLGEGAGGHLVFASTTRAGLLEASHVALERVARRLGASVRNVRLALPPAPARGAVRHLVPVPGPGAQQVTGPGDAGPRRGSRGDRRRAR